MMIERADAAAGLAAGDRDRDAAAAAAEDTAEPATGLCPRRSSIWSNPVLRFHFMV